METGSILFINIWLKLSAQPKKISHYKQYGPTSWQPITQQQFQKDIMATVDYFTACGLQISDQICLVLPNCYEWDVIEKACFFLGLNLVSIDPKHKNLLLENQLVLNSKIMIIKDEFPVSVSGIYIPILINLYQLPILTPVKVDLENIQFNADHSFDDLIAYTLFTSDLASESQAWCYTQQQIKDCVDLLGNLFTAHIHQERVLVWLPSSNPFKIIFNLIAFNLESVLYYQENPDAMIKSIRIIKPTVLIAMPFFFEKLKEKLQDRLESLVPSKLVPYKFIGDGLSEFLQTHLTLYLLGGQVKFCISAAAAIQADTLLYLQKHNLKILEAYTLSESILPVAINTPENIKLGSLGKPIELQSLQFSAHGEIFLSSKFLAKTHCNEQNFWLKTNDFGRLDNDGYLFLH
jgi:long-chain acyl-CoA synthetase